MRYKVGLGIKDMLASATPSAGARSRDGTTSCQADYDSHEPQQDRESAAVLISENPSDPSAPAPAARDKSPSQPVESSHDGLKQQREPSPYQLADEKVAKKAHKTEKTSV